MLSQSLLALISSATVYYLPVISLPSPFSLCLMHESLILQKGQSWALQSTIVSRASGGLQRSQLCVWMKVHNALGHGWIVAIHPLDCITDKKAAWCHRSKSISKRAFYISLSHSLG